MEVPAKDNQMPKLVLGVRE